MRNMILKDKRFDSIKGKIPKDLYNRFINRKRRVVEEEKEIRINMIKKLCFVNKDGKLEEILKSIAPLLRYKKRSILLIGRNYEEVNIKTEKAIVTYMSIFPKEVEESEQLGGESPH